MTITEKFLLCDNPESMPGPGLVISLQYPYWIGKVIQYSNKEDIETIRNVRFNTYQVKGFRIFLTIIGSLETEPVFDFDEKIFHAMADFYLTHKILKNESYYKRYKEETS